MATRTVAVSKVTRLAALHKCIRHGMWEEAFEIIAAFEKPGQLLLQATNIGWTGLHCAATYCTSDLSCWKRILQTALLGDDGGDENDHDDDYDPLKTSPDKIPCNTQSSSTTTNPFLKKTMSGMTPIDLFFARYLHPPAWQGRGIKFQAEKLVAAIENFTLNDELLHYIKHELREFHSSDGVAKKGDLEHVESPRQVEADSVSAVHFWFQLELLLRATYLGSLDMRRELPMLHALALTGCPSEVARLALALYPEQVTLHDEQGNLPIHVAIQSSCSRAGTTTASTTTPETSLFSCPPFLEAILKSFPNCAELPNKEGQLPIFLALSHGHTWDTGIQHLFRAYPDTMNVRDTKSGLLPFMIAACGDTNMRNREKRTELMAISSLKGMWRFSSRITRDRELQKAQGVINKQQLQTTFELLRASPESVGTAEHQAT